MKSKYKSRKAHNRRKSKYKVSTNKKPVLTIIIFILLIIGLYYIIPDSITITTNIDEYKKDEIKNIVKEVLDEQNQIEVQPVSAEIETEPATSRGADTVRDTIKTYTNYKITSYHPGDGYGSGTVTGSGKSIDSFSTMTIGSKQVYTYKGKIVVATATEELYNTGYSVKGSQTKQSDKHYFRYYDEFKIEIDGTYYDAIVLDSCGASMWKGEYRVDIFVPTNSDIINRNNVTIKI